MLSEACISCFRQLDPQWIDPAGALVVMRVEGGDLAGALGAASALTRDHPESARAHFTLSYVLRYAGFLEDAAHECDTALALDSKNPGWRSCATVFDYLSQYDRAFAFAKLDEGSEWYHTTAADIFLRRGELRRALESSRKGFTGAPKELQIYLEPCLEGRRAEDAGRLAMSLEPFFLAIRDSEPKFFFASYFCHCGDPGPALRLLRSAVEGNFLAYEAMDRDPLWKTLRGDPEFAAIRALAVERQKPLLALKPKPSPQSGGN